MGVTDELTKANERYAEGFDKGDLAEHRPHRDEPVHPAGERARLRVRSRNRPFA
jgi:hypothetical protein